MLKRTNTITPNIHTQTDRGNRHPAHTKEVAKALWLVAGGLLADHCDPAILAAESQDISAQR